MGTHPARRRSWVWVWSSAGDCAEGAQTALGFVGGHDVDGQVLLEEMALVEGLHTAIKLRIARVQAITDPTLLHNYMLGLSHPIGDEKLADMVNQALSVRKQFEQCEISLVTDGNLDSVVKLAKEGLDDEIARYLATKDNTENCKFCFEDVDTAKFHAVEGCTHRFCLMCTQKHLEASHVTQWDGPMRCPQPGCTTKLTVEGSRALLSSRLLEIMAQRLKEAKGLIAHTPSVRP